MFSLITHNPTTPVSVVCSPTFFGEDVSSSSGTVGSSFTLTPSGGSGIYTQLWTLSSTAGDGSLHVVDDTDITTTLTYTGLSYSGAEANAVLTGTVTDSLGSAASANINITVTRTSGGGLPP